MLYDTEQPNPDEINLVRLLRRLEKSVASQDEWTPGDASPVEEVLLNAYKTVQKVKFARGLIKTIEIECDTAPARSKRLNDAKIQLDRIDLFLKEIQQSLEPEPVKRESLLSKLPIPTSPPPTEEQRVPSYDGNVVSNSQNELDRSPASPSKRLSDPDDVSPSLISTALPSLLPVNPSETAKASSFSRSFGPTPTSRNVGGNQATTALQEELSSQLEQMAQQLKQNAIHFSTSLAKDKSVIEEAALKIESNFDTMQSRRVRLRDRTSQSLSNTCLIIGIILVVILLFMLMVMIIRFS